MSDLLEDLLLVYSAVCLQTHTHTCTHTHTEIVCVYFSRYVGMYRCMDKYVFIYLYLQTGACKL